MSSGCVDRGSYGDWESDGARTAEQRAADEVARLLAKEAPPALPESTLEALREILDAEGRRFDWTMPQVRQPAGPTT